MLEIKVRDGVDPCPTCGGSGMTNYYECHDCNGVGAFIVDRWISLDEFRALLADGKEE